VGTLSIIPVTVLWRFPILPFPLLPVSHFTVSLFTVSVFTVYQAYRLHVDVELEYSALPLN